jgi:hypothetical protein
MNHDDRSLERAARSWLDEGPTRAPDRAVEAALLHIQTTTQERDLRVPWRFNLMSTYARMAASIVVAVAIGAIGLWYVAGSGGQGTISPPASPSPTPALSPPATAIPTPTEGTASNFRLPFTYVLPDGPEFEFGPSSATYFEVRVPAWFEAGHPGGLIVQAIRSRPADPCDQASKVLPFVPRASLSVFDYLRTIPGVSVTNETSTTVDFSPARQATVVATPDADCPEIWAWAETTEPFIAGTVLRLVAFEVSSQRVVVTVFGEPENPTWPDLADGILASLRFQRGTPSPS